MALAQADNCTKCVSTDTIREIARYYSHSADVHRPSYVGDRHPIVDWRASVDALHGPILSVLDHALVRGISAIVEGVALDPSNELIARWRSAGGTAFGVLVKISEENKHLDAIRLRGYHKQLTHFSRIRRIQEEMISIAETSKDHWLQLEQTDVQAMVAEIIDHMKSRNNQ